MHERNGSVFPHDMKLTSRLKSHYTNDDLPCNELGIRRVFIQYNISIHSSANILDH